MTIKFARSCSRILQVHTETLSSFIVEYVLSNLTAYKKEYSKPKRLVDASSLQNNEDASALLGY